MIDDIAAILASLIITILIRGWLAMIFFGMVYAEFGLLAPIGFWTSTALAFLLPTIPVVGGPTATATLKK